MKKPMNTRKTAYRSLFAACLTAALFAIGCTDDKGTTPPAAEPGPLNRDSLLARGEASFNTCAGCHGFDGEGHPPSTPPLLHSDFLMAERLRPVRIMFLGLPNEIDTATTITVNGVDYIDQGMTSPVIDYGLSDTTIAAILTYVRVVMNDTLSVDCREPDTIDGIPYADCDLEARPASEVAQDSVMPDEVAAIRAQLIADSLFIE